MNTKEKGDSYEEFVKNVYTALLYTENENGIKNIKIDKNVKIKDKLGNDRQIDVYWEYELLGQIYKTAVECKNYNFTISIDKVEAFATKIRTLGLSKGIMATKKGFQSGAISTAKDNNISLIIIREPEDKDWEGRIKKIILHMHYLPPPSIDLHSFQPFLDWEWLDENIPDFDGKIKVSGFNNEIIITNFEGNKDVSIWEIENSVLPRYNPGTHEWGRKFDDSFLVVGEKSYKIAGLKFKYTSPEIFKDESIMDFSDHLYAIMEYIGEERKVAVMRDGMQKTFS